VAPAAVISHRQRSLGLQQGGEIVESHRGTSESAFGSRRHLFALMLIAAACVALAVSSTASAAAPSLSYGYKQGDDIGTASEVGGFAHFGEVATDEDGYTFVANQVGSGSFEGYIDVIAPDGTSVAHLANGEFGGLYGPEGVAVSPDGSALYAVNVWTEFFGGSVVEKWTSDGADPPTYTRDPSFNLAAPFGVNTVRGVAVDPTNGDLVVGAGAVYRFDSTSGSLISSFDGSTTELGTFSAGALATSPDGDIYVSAGPGRVEHMGSDGRWVGALHVPPGETSDSPFGIAVNPQNGDVAVKVEQRKEFVIEIFTPTDELKETIRLLPPLATGSYGLAYSYDGSRLYVASNNGTAKVFRLGTRPGTDPPVASEITSTGARLSAVVATGGESSTARMEYCQASNPACEKYLLSLSSDPSAPDYSPEASSDPWSRLPEHADLSSPTSDAISDEVVGLELNTRYLVRTWAVNDAGGAEGISAIGTFKTAVIAPEVETGAAGSVTTAFAELTGTINAVGDQTTYYFEYGLTSSYGRRVPAGAAAIAGAGRVPRTFSQAIHGLAAGTTYHYRLVAENSAGRTLGSDKSFTTLSADRATPQRAYEEVSAPDKQGLSIYANFGFQVEANGSAFVYSAQSAAAYASSSTQTSRYLARRETSGWSGQTALDPPLGTTRAILFSSVQAVSSDAEHALVVSQKALTPDAIEGAANIYMSDVGADTYQLVGTATENVAFSGMVGPNKLTTFMAGAPNFSWIILNSHYPLLPGAPQSAIYKWTEGGGLSLISLLGSNTIPTGVVRLTQMGTNAVSDDGEAIAFALEGGQEGVYLRSAGHTIPISVAQYSGGPSGPQAGFVDGISRDGSGVVLQSNAQLTEDATDSGEKLYRYDAATERLAYLGPIPGGSQINLMGISDDAETVYFNGPNETLVWHDGKRHVVYPAALRGALYGHASMSGNYFEFLVADGLFGDRAVHLYDAETEEETCISCPAGGGSVGVANIGEYPIRDINNSFAQVVTDDGHAFFDTTAPLLAADHNVSSDVYEYFNGRLALVSPGDRDFAAILAGISKEGTDVFFTTAEGLVPKDTDQSYDVYDARIGGGFSEPVRQNECTGESCRNTAMAPPGPTIGSRTAAAVRAKQGSGIRRIKALGAADRAALARGAKVQLKVTITRPGTVVATGVVKLGRSSATVIHSSVKVKRSGEVNLPLSLSKKALSQLRTSGSLAIRLSVRFGGEKSNVSTLHLRAAGGKDVKS